MKAVVIHAAKDLRIEEREPEAPGPDRSRSPSRPAASAAPTCTTTITAASARCDVREPMMLGHEVAGTVTALARA